MSRGTTRARRGRVDAPVLLAITVLVTLFTVLLMLVSITAGLSNNFSRGLSSGLTTRWIEEVWSLYGATAWRSVLLALACVVVVGVIYQTVTAEAVPFIYFQF